MPCLSEAGRSCTLKVLLRVQKEISTLTVFTFFLPQLPLVIALQSSSSASLGSLSLYRNSVQCFFFTARNLLNTIQMAFQSIFLLGAFSAAMEMEPRMQPKKGSALAYMCTGKGMKLEARFVFCHDIMESFARRRPDLCADVACYGLQ